MTKRAQFLEKVFGALMGAVFILYIIPVWHPSNLLSTSLLLGSIGIMAYALGQFFAGDRDTVMLVVVALVIGADVVLVVLNPGGIV